jgi:4-hydroxy-2-oxoheptanedioate aldolase
LVGRRAIWQARRVIDLRELWASGGTAIGAWTVIASTIATEAAARLGFDYVSVDQQHGPVDYQSALSMLQTVALCDTTPITRVPSGDPAYIGKMLDAGAHSVIVPMINTREQAEAIVSATRYGPEGTRSWGPTVAGLRHPNYAAAARDHVSVIPMIETTHALDNLDDILSVDGVDAIYIGPADLSISLGLPAKNNDGEKAFDEAMSTIVAACKRHGVMPGVHANGALAAQRVEQGFRMVTVASDILSIRSGMSADLKQGREALGGTATVADSKSGY